MDNQHDDVNTSRRRKIDNITFEGITKLCTGAGFETMGKTLRDLKTWLINNTNVSLELEDVYIKTQPSVFVNVRRPTVAVSSPVERLSPSADGVDNESEKKYVDCFRVPLVTRESTKSKKVLWIIIRGASTFLGAFPTRKSVVAALHKRYPDIDISQFEDEEGYDDIRLVSFESERLLDDSI